jgi:hypothetical protein
VEEFGILALTNPKSDSVFCPTAERPAQVPLIDTGLFGDFALTQRSIT